MQIVKIIGSVALVCLGFSAHAETAAQKGKATAKYTAVVLTQDVKDSAVLAAEMKAVDAYYASLGDAATEAQDSIMAQIKADPDRYFLNNEILDEQDNPAARTYTVVVRTTFNTARLRLLLKGNANAVVAASGGERSQIGFIFISRAVDSQTTYDARVFKRVDASAAGDLKATSKQTGSEGESVSKSQISTNASKTQAESASVDVSATVETGGSTTQKAAVSTYRLLPSANVGQSVSKEFKGAGFRVAEAAFIEPLSNGKLKVAAIEADYKSGNDLQSNTLNNVVSGLRAAHVRYFSIATLDAGVASIDGATGQTRVSVTVNAKVIDAGQGIPEVVATVGPTQRSALGINEDEARTAAIQMAAQIAARDLTSQLTNAGIR